MGHVVVVLDTVILEEEEEGIMEVMGLIMTLEII